jgi:prepilin-type N-terminal cleavage/methylation domain-containing protein
MSANSNTAIEFVPFIRVKRQVESGFTLIEVLLCLTMLALIMLPFTLAMNSTGNATRLAYQQSTRTILLNSLKNETTPSDPFYKSTFTDGSMQTGISDAGQTLGYRRVVDATTSGATNAMKRTTLFYLYTNTTDASSAARYRATAVSYPKVFRMHFGNNTAVIDTLNRYWYPDNVGDTLYDAINKVPGWGSAKTSSNSASDILNTSGNDDQLYQNEVAVTSGTFNMDVENGDYTVKVLWCENYASVNSTTYRRLMNVTIEGSKMNTTGPYSVYESTGGLNYAQITMYDVKVTDGVLTINFAADSSSDSANATPKGIEVIKRSAL